MQAGENDFVARLETAEDGIRVAYGFAEGDRNLVRDVSVALCCCDEDEGLATDSSDGEDRNDRSGSSAPGNASLDELFGAEPLRGARDRSFREDALQAVVYLRREEADG